MKNFLGSEQKVWEIWCQVKALTFFCEKALKTLLIGFLGLYSLFGNGSQCGNGKWKTRLFYLLIDLWFVLSKYFTIDVNS